MKCHRNAEPYSACFASRSCARFSPTTVTPASTSTLISRSGTYFVAVTTVTPGPTISCTAASRARTSSGDVADHPLHATRAAVAAMREEQLRAAHRAEVDAFDASDAGRAEEPFGRRPQVEPAVAREIRLEATGDVGTDFVAARADRRSDRGGD